MSNGKFSGVTVSLFALLLLAAPATAEEQPLAAAPPRPPAVKAAAPNVSPITQAAVKAGALACTSRINQVANFLTAGVNGTGAILFIPPANPDQQLISVSLEIPKSEVSSAYATASFAPNQANGCGGIYETVVYWPTQCDEVAGSSFVAFKRLNAFSKNMTVLDGGISTKIFLMSAGTGCVSIKKELIR